MNVEQLLKEMKASLERMSYNGMTNARIASIAQISQSRMNDYINGSPETLGSMRLESALRLFPDILGGHTINQSHNAQAIGIQHNSAAADKLQCIQRVIINDEGICAECKIKVLKLLMDEI